MILGLYNESRGKDSCGYYYSGNVERGVGNNSNFSDFVAKEGLVPGLLPAITFMGHTRKSTHGSNTYDNAHPHVVDNNYVQTHNGVIKEIWPLCHKYKINTSKIHVDSIGLAHLINKVGPKEILEQYTGYAALAFTWKDNPKALYLYHGRSKETQYGAAISERPLFILIQEEGIYYSSMKESLVAINDSPGKDTPFLLQHNKVWEIIHGECTGNTIDIDRENANIGINITSTTPTPTPATPHQSSNNYQIGGKFNPKSLLKPAPASVIPNEEEDDEEENNTTDMLFSETYPDLNFENPDRVIYHQGRFHMIHKTSIGEIVTLPLQGEYVLDRQGYIVDESLGKLQYLKPQQKRHYFINGVMIKSEFDYRELIKDGINGHTEPGFRMLSRKSRHPIFNMRTAWNGGDNLWYHAGNKVWKTEFTPKFSDRKYRIRKGVTTQIRTV